MSKILHVELFEPYNEKKHYYFGSKAAIYSVLPVEVVGITYKSLSNHYDLSKGPYENKLCIIRQDELIRKAGNRG